MHRKINLQESIGGLAYIPSAVVVYKLGGDSTNLEALVPTEHKTLREPAIVPLLSAAESGTMAKVYYNGGVWWADADDLYEVEQNE
jgi:hypothetical protein